MADGGWLMSMTRRGRAAVLLMAVLLTLWPAAPSAFAQADDAAHQQFLFAYKLLQRGEARLAADAFDEYLGKFPHAEKRGDAVYYRALLYHQGDDDQAAADLLGKDFPKPQLVPGYAVDLLRGQVLSDLGQYDKAVAALEKIDTGNLKATTAASVQFLKGVAYRGAGNLDAAAKALNKAARADSPLGARAKVNLARVLAQMGKVDQAIKTLGPVTRAQGPIAAEAARLAGDLSYQQQQYKQAVGLYAKVLSAHQSSEHFGPSVIGTLWAQYSAKQYQNVLDTCKQYLPALAVQDRVTAMYLAASAHQKLAQHKQARQVFQQLTSGDNDFPLMEKSLYKLAVSQYQLKQYDAMRKTVARLGKRFPKSSFRVDAAFLEATADANSGDVSRGAARLTALIDQSGNPYHGQALLQRARLYEHNDRLDPASEDYHHYLDQADWSDPNTWAAALTSIDVDNRRGDPQGAHDTAARVLKRDDLDPATRQEAMYRMAIAQIRSNKAKQALDTLDQLHARYPLNAFQDQAAYYRGVIRMSLNQPEQAIPLLSEAAQAKSLDQPLRVNALRLIALQQRDSAPAKAQATLVRLRKLAGLDTLTDREKLFMGRRLLGRGQPRQALTYLQPITRTSGSNETIAHGWYLLGKARRDLGRYDQASQALRRVVAMGKGFDLDARLELGMVKADRGDPQAGIDELRELTSAQSSDIAAKALFHSGMMYRQLAQQQRRQDNTQAADKSNEQARQMLKKLVLLYPYPELTPLPQRAYIELAQIAAQQGAGNQAVNELKELIDKFPSSPYATYARAVLAEGQQHLGKAVALLRSLKDKSLDPDLASWVSAKLQSLDKGAGS